jgi:hypothetical protein
VNESESITEAVERYLREGASDADHRAWPGNFLDRARRGRDELLGALAAEVRRKAVGRQHAAVPKDLDLVSWTRRKLTPMVQGFFPRAEQEPVLSLLERSVVFLTADNIERILLGQRWLHTAWDLANLCLSSVAAEMLGPEAESLVGLSEEVTCFVSALDFRERDRMEDFVIHEAAHIFHNRKRATVGLPETRTREWLLPIAFGRRETFAYSCEGYGWIVEHAADRASRMTMADDFTKHALRLNEETIEPTEVAGIVREACEARNGWKVILGRCAPPKPVRRQVPSMTSGINE